MRNAQYRQSIPHRIHGSCQSANGARFSGPFKTERVLRGRNRMIFELEF